MELRVAHRTLALVRFEMEGERVPVRHGDDRALGGLP